MRDELRFFVKHGTRAWVSAPQAFLRNHGMYESMKIARPPEIKTRDYLDQPRRCANPDCRLSHRGADFILVAGCHPDTPPVARYIDGVIHFACKVCNNYIDSFKISQS